MIIFYDLQCRNIFHGPGQHAPLDVITCGPLIPDMAMLQLHLSTQDIGGRFPNNARVPACR
jgi:hypothetical protein